MSHLNDLHNKYKDQGLVVLGIHTTRGADKMADFVRKAGILYPVAPDLERKTVAAFRVDGFPDYHLVDRAGKLRFADIANGEIERAIKMLLKEPKPKVKKVVKVDAREVLKKAQAQAKAEGKKLFVHLGAPW